MGLEQRRAKRRAIHRDAMIYGLDGKPIVSCALRDISTTGTQLALTKEAELPRLFILGFSLGGQVRRKCCLVWQFSIVVGVRFLPSPSSDHSMTFDGGQVRTAGGSRLEA